MKNGKFVLPVIHMPKLTDSGRLEMQPIEFNVRINFIKLILNFNFKESNIIANEGMDLNNLKEGLY